MDERWRWATWVFLIWAVVFPILWTLFTLTAEGEDGESLRVYDIAFLAMVGGAMWLVGLVAAFLIWEADHWFVSRRRRP